MATQLPEYYQQQLTHTNFRLSPETYQIGKGEQGVLMIEPYKSELLPHWRFKTPLIAKTSAKKLYAMFLSYGKKKDFVGMDMARKYLQMGYTRSRRYANYKGGKKYINNPQKAKTILEAQTLRKQMNPQNADWQYNEKAQSAAIFLEYYQKALRHKTYKTLKQKHLELQKKGE